MKGKKVEVSDFFPDFGQVYSICHVDKETCSHEALSQQKRFRLNIHITSIRQKGTTGQARLKRG